ncbi:hypothetical protein PRIPAC_75692 [Pristionchus pacificus]|uniref:Uncharacterized protein n=1 Tax=Pristionchus pacificus TaxID=54126 RepID=A0A2A6BFA2_PRIPA|nr:hypothetical protein PRIPAC_75692 [Pristionchus pacificus]|eukprot:PDM64533.1 hypothetical protein PRIPAC_52789 [Pristionchus pacificus]
MAYLYGTEKAVKKRTARLNQDQDNKERSKITSHHPLQLDDGRVIGATGGRLIDEVDGVVITPSGEETDVIVRKELDTEVGRKAEKLIVLGSKEESTVAEDVVVIYRTTGHLLQQHHLAEQRRRIRWCSQVGVGGGAGRALNTRPLILIVVVHVTMQNGRSTAEGKNERSKEKREEEREEERKEEEEGTGEGMDGKDENEERDQTSDSFLLRRDQ